MKEIIILLGAAVVAVPLFRRLGLGAVLGYLAAGVVIGPWGLGAVDDVDDILHLAELGVVLLLFIIGLELRPSRLWTLRRSIFGFGAAQLLISAVLLAAAALLLGIPIATAALVGVVLALSSTAFALQLMAERHELTTRFGRTAFSTLLFQDLAVVPLLAIVPLLGNPSDSRVSAGDVIAPVVVLVLVVAAGRYILRYTLRIVALSGVREILTATALLIVLGVATLMQASGLSMALGAFLAGVLLADSEFRHQLEADIEPFKGLLLGLFFIAVGMSLNVGLLAADAGLIAAAVALLVFLKAAVLWALGLANGLGMDGSRRLAVTLSQGGEFAFVIFGAAVAAGVLDRELAGLLIVVVSLSMVTTPMLVLMLDWLAPRAAHDPVPAELPEAPEPVIIAGFGRFGQMIARVLRARKIPFTALDASQEQVDFVKRYGNKIYYGDASRLDLLSAAGAGSASIFVLAIDDVEASLRTATVVRRHFLNLQVYARARNRKHAHQLMDLGVTVVQRETFLSAMDLTENVLRGLGFSSSEARRTVGRFIAHDVDRLHEHANLHTDEERMRDLAKTAAQELEEMFERDVQDEFESAEANALRDK